MPNLQTILNAIQFDDLPAAWTTHNLVAFSRAKGLWDYQQAALRNALKALWKFYDGENDELKRKGRFFQSYADVNIPLAPVLPLGKKRTNLTLLSPYYPVTPPVGAGAESSIPYQYFINRMGFWMATGSGKTLVIVKLLELLWTLMQRGLIPVRDVMVLTHREDLIQQLQDHVDEFNTAGTVPHLQLRELREYPEVKRGLASLLGHQELTVFYYRSDNLSTEQKERLVDFRNYDNNGQWYLLLDEAHKGDKEDSKRQHIYNILSRNGFLFNFSATFTDQRDILTTACEFNLASFIASGYGKHLSLLKQENRAFKDKEDFTNEEKQRIVLQSLLMLAYASKARERLCDAVGANLYHLPLLVALVNSVNTDEADLKLFFRELVRIGKGDISTQAFTAAKTALRSELSAAPELLYEGLRFTLDQSLFDSLTLSDVLRHVFNAESPGTIEVLVRPTNDKELAFKLKSAALPFALIKIGSIARWLKSELADYEIVKGFEDESFFARLNQDDSNINLLMGSRSFYEGWDSNRPNVITFINIGTGVDARKFILQSVGRGVRLEPLKGRRQRLEVLHTAGAVDDLTFQAAHPFLPAVQSLFIFGTKRAALETILNDLAEQKEKEVGTELALEVNTPALSHHPILIPVYRGLHGQLLVEQQAPRKFEIQDDERALLKSYLDYLGDPRLLLAKHGLSPQQIGLLDKTLAAPATYFNPHATRKFGAVEIMLPRLAQYFDIVPQTIESFKPLEDEINHFKHIRVLLKDIHNLQQKIARVKNYVPTTESFEELARKVQIGEITPQELAARMNEYANSSPAETFDYNGEQLEIRQISQHYYMPLLLTDVEKIAYVNHVIHFESEVRFVRELEAYLKAPNNLLEQYDWWLFCHTDQTTDRVVLPYYNPKENRISDFHPDFVFWLVKGTAYTILFVDPKGMTATDYQHKIDDYAKLFRHDQGTYRIFKHNGYQVRVALAMYTTDANLAPQEYKQYWYDHPGAILQKLA